MLCEEEVPLAQHLGQSVSQFGPSVWALCEHPLGACVYVGLEREP